MTLGMFTGCEKKEEAVQAAVIDVAAGETATTRFFTCSIDSGERLHYYEDYVPEDDEVLVLLHVTLENTTEQAQPMFDSDFTLLPNGAEANAVWMRDAMDDEMYPAEFTLEAGERVQWKMLFTVPSSANAFSLQYKEYYVTEAGEQKTGDTYRLALPVLKEAS